VTARDLIVFRTLAGCVVEGPEVPACLAVDGVVVFTGARRDLLVSAMAGWAEFREHPDADESGFTVIEPRVGVAVPGDAGFSRARIAPHTDRAVVAKPPAVVAVVIEHAAERGGQVLLADLRGCRELAEESSAASLRLESRLTGIWPVVQIDEGLLRVRYRDDAVARPRATGGSGRRLLGGIQMLAALPAVLQLGTGEGYIVHNHRILHGRESFHGYRRAARLLADVRPGHSFAWLNYGFAS
jgi:hypothetical protein